MASLLSLFVYASALSYPSFQRWATFYGKKYSGATERDYRNSIFDANVQKIYNHNMFGTSSWAMEVNKFADLTATEWKERMGGCFFGEKANATTLFTQPLRLPSALPKSVDWTTKGAVTPVKNQEQCGSCWAFSATGALEAAYALAPPPAGQLFNLSEQQLVDCSTSEGNQGCNGGLMDYAFQYVIDNNGLSTDAAYPYSATGPNACQNVSSVMKISNFTDVPTNSEAALMAAIAQQPVSVAVEADQNSFQFYSSGVMTSACGTQLDHGVLAVGYGTLNGVDFYKVKNSWGTDWGMDGYILLGRGDSFGSSGQCGIQMDPSFPNV